MSVFHKFFNKSNLDFFYHIKETEFLTFSINSDRENYRLDYKAIKPNDPYRSVMALIRHSGCNTAMDAYLTTQILTNGPKIIRPNQVDFEALEHYQINIGFDDIIECKPFDTIIIELPENYYKNKFVKNLQGGIGPWKEQHSPVMSVLHYGPDYIISGVYFDDEQVVTSCIWNLKDELLMEEILDKLKNENMVEPVGSFEISDDEHTIVHQVLKSSINLVLILDEVGVKSLGPNNPSYLERLKKYKNKTKIKSELIELDREIIKQPTIFTFNQEVKIFDTAKESNHISHLNPTSRDHYSVKPHWRRGCWVQQPYGVNRSLRKRIRRKPVLVNKHLFLGNNSDTTTIYS